MLYHDIAFAVGAALLVWGGVSDIMGAIGLLRFKNFYLRLHAATVSSIGGAVYPLIGVALIAFSATYLGPLRYLLAGISATTAGVLLLIVPAGSHALARAAYRSGLGPEPAVCDHLRGRRRR